MKWKLKFLKRKISPHNNFFYYWPRKNFMSCFVFVYIYDFGIIVLSNFICEYCTLFWKGFLVSNNYICFAFIRLWKAIIFDTVFVNFNNDWNDQKYQQTYITRGTHIKWYFELHTGCSKRSFTKLIMCYMKLFSLK